MLSLSDSNGQCNGIPVTSIVPHQAPAAALVAMQSPLPGFAPMDSEGAPPPPYIEGPYSAGAAAEGEAKLEPAAAQPEAVPSQQQADGSGSGAQQSLAAKFEAADTEQRRIDSQVWGIAAAEAAEEPPFHQQDGWEGEPLSPAASPQPPQQQQPGDGWDGEEPPFHQEDSWDGEPLSPAAAVAAKAAQHANQPSAGLPEEPPLHQEDSWAGEPLSPASRAAALQQEQQQATEEPPAHQPASWAGELLGTEAADLAASSEAAQPAAGEAAPASPQGVATAAEAAAEGWGDLDEEPWEAVVEEEAGQSLAGGAVPEAAGDETIPPEAAAGAGINAVGLGAGDAAAPDAASELRQPAEAAAAVVQGLGSGGASASAAPAAWEPPAAEAEGWGEDVLAHVHPAAPEADFPAANDLPAEAEGWGDAGTVDVLPPELAAEAAAHEPQPLHRDQPWQGHPWQELATAPAGNGQEQLVGAAADHETLKHAEGGGLRCLWACLTSCRCLGMEGSSRLPVACLCCLLLPATSVFACMNSRPEARPTVICSTRRAVAPLLACHPSSPMFHLRTGGGGLRCWPGCQRERGFRLGGPAGAARCRAGAAQC